MDLRRRPSSRGIAIRSEPRLHTRSSTRLAGLHLAVALAIGLFILSACGAKGDRFVTTLDALAVPSTWEAQHTEVVDQGFDNQARATRYFFVDADPVDGLAMAKKVAEEAGFIVRPRVLSLNGCEDGFPPEAMDGPCGPVVADDCRDYSGDCVVEALRWHVEGEQVERLWINLEKRGTGFSIGRGNDRQYVSDPDRALFRITADMENRDSYLPLPSWPPAQ